MKDLIFVYNNLIVGRITMGLCLAMICFPMDFPAQLRFSQEKYEEAALLLDGIPQSMLTSNMEEKEIPDLLSLITVVKELPETLSLSQQNELETIVAESGPWASSWAESLLMNFGFLESYDPIYLPDEIPLEERSGRINPKDPHRTLKCYPNPASDFVIVKSKKAIMEAQVVGVTGKTLLVQKDIVGAFEIILNVRDFAPGLYQLQITYADGENVIEPIVVE